MSQRLPYQLVSLNWKKNGTVIEVKGTEIGGEDLFMIAGPCAVESEDQIEKVAAHIKELGIPFIRGGAYKPRTSPYNFQGLQEEGLEYLKIVSDKYNLGVVTELMDLALLPKVYDATDIIQVGARNMKNYHMLKELGKVDKPILLKRGMDATVEEWLLAAEYILLGGNEKVILCERGIRTFDTSVRNTMDIGAIVLAKQLSHLPVIADPSQGTGKRSLVGPMSAAAVVAGADGLMIEIHPDPENALSDGQQSLNFDEFDEILPSIKGAAELAGKLVSFTKQKKDGQKQFIKI